MSDHVDARSSNGRKVIYIDVGSMPPKQALAYVHKVRDAYRTAAVVDEYPRPDALVPPARVTAPRATLTLFGLLAAFAALLWSLMR